MLRNAADSGIAEPDPATVDLSLLGHPRETDLLLALAEFSGVVATAAELREPHRVARYLEEIAGLYHRWYDNCRVVPQGEDPIEAVHSTRLRLNEATAQVLRNGLSLLGVTAPDRM